MSDPTPRVERYRPEDRAAAEALIAELDPEHAERVPEHFARMLALLAIDAAAVLLMRAPGDPEGRPIALLALERTYWNATTFVGDLIVHEGYRSQGLGAALLLEAAAISRAWGCRRIYLTTGLRNQRAQLFYLRHGFVPEGIRLDYSDPGDHEIGLYLDL
jgi:GNAT superfamily N-acetyltransferase